MGLSLNNHIPLGDEHLTINLNPDYDWEWTFTIPFGEHNAHHYIAKVVCPNEDEAVEMALEAFCKVHPSFWNKHDYPDLIGINKVP